MIESIRQSVVYMAHTHDGARVAMNCLWHGTAKVCTCTNTAPTCGHVGVLLHSVGKCVRGSAPGHTGGIMCPTRLAAGGLSFSAASVTGRGGGLERWMNDLNYILIRYSQIKASPVPCDLKIVTFQTLCVIIETLRKSKVGLTEYFCLFQDRKIIIKTMKSYMVKFATVRPRLLFRKTKFMFIPASVRCRKESYIDLFYVTG